MNQVTPYAAQIAAAFLRSHPMPLAQVPDFIASVRDALENPGAAPPAEPVKLVPAVPIRRSITPNYIICLEDGAQLRMLKRYLMARYGLTPTEYRRRWGLPHDYPMVAPGYSAIRSDHAKRTGLGKTIHKGKTR